MTATGGSGGSSLPDVTVVLAVFNTMPYLTRTLDSLVSQSIGQDRMEVIAVDDGSTDGSGEELDRHAERHPSLISVIHQNNSGGPAGPCNRALDVARGRYVYFLGADDYLGPEALQRMVAYGDEHAADIVMGRVVGVNGRFIRQRLFSENEPELDRYGPDLRWSLANTNLYRRSLLERLHLRYLEGLPFGSDQPFMLEAVVNADRVAVLADYTCYYAVDRHELTNISYSTPYSERLRCIEVLVETAARLVPEGAPRDTILVRHFSWEIPSLLRHGLRERPASFDTVVADVASLVDRYGDERIFAELRVVPRVMMHLAQRGEGELLREMLGEASPARPRLLASPSGVYVDLPGFSQDDPDPAYLVPDRQGLRDRLADALATAAASWEGPVRARRLVVEATTNLVDPAGLTQVGAVLRRAGEERAVEDVTALREADGIKVIVRVSAAELLEPPTEQRGWRLRLGVTAGGHRVDVPLPPAPEHPGRTRFWHAGAPGSAWVEESEHLVLGAQRIPLKQAFRALARRLPGRR